MPPENWEQRAKETPLRIEHLDEDLLDRAFLAALNNVRSRKKVPTVAYSNSLDATATAYAEDMSRFEFFGHVHPHRAEHKTPGDRIKLNWPDVTYTGENLAEFSPYVIATMRARYFIKENADGSVTWLDQRKRPLELHTYWSFAQFITEKWLGSRGHRENLLSPNFEFVGMGYEPNHRRSPDELPTLYIVQNFGAP